MRSAKPLCAAMPRPQALPKNKSISHPPQQPADAEDLEQDRGYCFEWAAGPLSLTAPAVLRTVVSEPAVSALRDNNVARQICEQSDLRAAKPASSQTRG